MAWIDRWWGVLVGLVNAPAVSPTPIAEGQSTLDVIYQAAMVKIAQQQAEANFQDTKAIGILTAASLIVTVAPAARLSARPSPVQPLAIVLLVLAGIAYVALMWNIRNALHKREFDFPPNPRELFDQWWDQPVDEVKGMLVALIGDAYNANKLQLDRKIGATSNGLWLIIVESLLLTFGIVVS